MFLVVKCTKFVTFLSPSSSWLFELHKSQLSHDITDTKVARSINFQSVHMLPLSGMIPRLLSEIASHKATIKKKIENALQYLQVSEKVPTNN